VTVEGVRWEGGVIVVVADIAEKEGVFGDIGELAGIFQWGGALGRPPGVEVTALTTAQARTTPAAIHALS
jgi:phage gpG-like protein